MADAPAIAPPADVDADLAWVRQRQQVRERWIAAGVADTALVQATSDVALVLAAYDRVASASTSSPVTP